MFFLFEYSRFGTIFQAERDAALEGEAAARVFVSKQALGQAGSTEQMDSMRSFTSTLQATLASKETHIKRLQEREADLASQIENLEKIIAEERRRV